MPDTAVSTIDQRMAWNAVSAAYQKLHDRPLDSASYGPWSPPESELQLLGDVAGLRILDLGCGGGQNCIAFARQSARVTGVDLSEMQIAHARRLAAAEGVSVDLVLGSMVDLGAFDTGATDIVFSCYTFPYIADIARCLAECARVLCPGGRLVFSLDHPIRGCFFDEEAGELLPYPARDYFDETPVRWRFDGTSVRMETIHRTLDTWIELLNTAGFHVARLLEPAPPAAMLDELWPEDDPRAPLRNLPQCVIFLAEKR